ncbi:hypothetical protein CIB84_011514 [Bambusicola thoracicus]|uniref:Uncharacterized protein n=1 Tax=Bambusicola thoracicus TaxID=9083 RepID=A0A2P4SKV7_BAMTH|nr:hypothetical protein CIB84_011514 [Bambusicola thoracicus]
MNIISTPLLILLWFSQNSGSRSHLLEDHHRGTERTTTKCTSRMINSSI